jgi:hypothetical protein
VRTAAAPAAYSRAAFGKGWKDPDGNGCNTGNDVLARDMTAVRTRPGGCVVLSGRLLDSYIGRTSTITSVTKGVTVDFVVSLPSAWQSGAYAWTTSERIAFVNDPANLQTVRAATATRKRSRDASQYLPSAVAYRCTYIARQIGVKYRYELSVTEAERAAMRTVLGTCPRQPLPASARVGATPDPGSPAAAPPQASPPPPASDPFGQDGPTTPAL